MILRIIDLQLQQMENQKSQTYLQQYHQKLNTLVYSPIFEKLAQFFQQDQARFSQVLYNCENSFFGRVEREIMVAKKKILEELFLSYKILKPEQRTQLQMRLRGLILSPQKILRDGIIGIYSDITLLRENGCGQEKCEFNYLLDKIILALEPLLRNYFILKEIEKNDHVLAGGSLGIILSQKKISNSSDSLVSINSTHSIKQMLSDRALKQITHTIQLKSIEQLINQELKQNEISQVEETCRICRNLFKVRVLEKHVQYCSKIEAENSKRQEIIEKQMQIVQLIKEELMNKSQEISDEKLRIYKKIVSQFEDPNSLLMRKISYYGSKRKQKSIKKISSQIEKYLKNKNMNTLLWNFHLQTRQRQMIEKKISSLSANYLYCKDQQSIGNENLQSKYKSSKIRSSQNCKTTKLVSIKTKKSLFARKQQSQDSHFDSKTGQFTTSQIKKFQSIKVHMEQIFDSCSQSDFEQKVKLHKSLSNFAKKDEEKRNQISVDDFEILKFLGKGAFGKVYLVRRKKTQDIYALKVIKIQQNWDQKQLISIKNEHEILSQIAGQHLVKAPFSFTQGQAHFFVLEYMPGGDLGKVIEQQVYLDYEQSRFYLAEIVLALERLHQMGIIHRDLKPENLIFDEMGHLKLTDFGLSEIRINDKIRKVKRLSMQIGGQGQLQETTFLPGELRQKKKSKLVEGKKKAKIIGTPDYIAPEIISGESLDNMSIDWWSLGVIAYEMMVGCRPFCANTVEEVIENIEKFKIEWPAIGEQDDEISPTAADFIKKLLNPNYQQRLGSKSVEEIKAHQIFQGINWAEIKSIKPPLTPIIDGKQNYQYAEELPQLKYEIKSAIGNYQAKSSLRLENFVRYDILVEETLSSADKRIVKRSAKIKKLKSIASNFGSSSGGNKEQSKDLDGYFREQSFDEQSEKCLNNYKND